MTTFGDREHAYEAKFAHDADLRFKAEARSVKIAAQWAAGLLGKTGDALEAYVAEVLAADFEEAGKEDVVRKLVADLAGKADESTIREALQKAMGEAMKQLASAE